MTHANYLICTQKRTIVSLSSPLIGKKLNKDHVRINSLR